MMLDGTVRAHAGAAPALDALLLVDVGLLVLKGDGPLRADLAARVSQAALARIAHLVRILLASVAGELDDVDQRRLVVGLRLGGIGHALGQLRGLVHTLQRQAHR